MTAFFKDLGKKISDVTQDASKKASDMIEISKINSSISAERNIIAETQKKIGAVAYSLFAGGETLPEVLTPDFQLIAAKLQNITSLENKIAEIKAAADKPQTEAAPEAAAEPAPAAPAEPVEPAEPAEPVPEEPSPAEAAPEAAAPAEPAPRARFCTNCGSPVEPGMMFCGNCGHKVS